MATENQGDLHRSQVGFEVRTDFSIDKTPRSFSTWRISYGGPPLPDESNVGSNIIDMLQWLSAYGNIATKSIPKPLDAHLFLSLMIDSNVPQNVYWRRRKEIKNIGKELRKLSKKSEKKSVQKGKASSSRTYKRARSKRKH